MKSWRLLAHRDIGGRRLPPNWADAARGLIRGMLAAVDRS
jgi:hypothetical protein